MFEQYVVKYDANIVDAMSIIGRYGLLNAYTLLVVDANGAVLGTLTDGDIRRCIIKNRKLQIPVIDVANKDFIFFNVGECNVLKIKEAKAKGITLIPILDKKKRIIDVINLNKLKSYLPIDVVLMAGGKGERLRPLTEKTPKPLLKIGGKAIIDYNVERLISYGIKNISVTVNYLKEQFENHFSLPIDNVLISTVREPMYLGTIGSVRFVKTFYHDTILVMNSDLFTDIDYEDFYLHFKSCNSDMSVAVVPYSISVPYGVLDLEGRNIKGVIEKPTYNYYVNAGIYLIKLDLLNLLPPDSFFNATDFIELLIKKSYNVVRYPLNGTWIDIGNHHEYQKACEFVKHLCK